MCISVLHRFKKNELNKIIINNQQYNLSAKSSDTVIRSLLGHNAHAVPVAGLGHLAHLGPLVCIRIIIQHFGQSSQSLCLPQCPQLWSGLPVLTTCNVGL